MAPTYEDIERRAYQLWKDRGCPLDSPEVDWEQAKQELSESAASDDEDGGPAKDDLPSGRTANKHDISV